MQIEKFVAEWYPPPVSLDLKIHPGRSLPNDPDLFPTGAGGWTCHMDGHTCLWSKDESIRVNELFEASPEAFDACNIRWPG